MGTILAAPWWWWWSPPLSRSRLARRSSAWCHGGGLGLLAWKHGVPGAADVYPLRPAFVASLLAYGTGRLLSRGAPASDRAFRARPAGALLRFAPMTADAWITVGVVLGMLALMVFTKIGADIVMLGGLTFLLLLGIPEPAEAFAGFSNPALVAIAALLVVATGVRETGAMEYVGRFVLGRTRNLPGAQLRMMFPVAFLSAVLNNTPLVAGSSPWSRAGHAASS